MPTHSATVDTTIVLEPSPDPNPPSFEQLRKFQSSESQSQSEKSQKSNLLRIDKHETLDFSDQKIGEGKIAQEKLLGQTLTDSDTRSNVVQASNMTTIPEDSEVTKDSGVAEMVLEDTPPEDSRLEKFLRRYRALHPDFDPYNNSEDNLHDVILFGDSDFSHWRDIETKWNDKTSNHNNLGVVNVGVGGAEMLFMAYYAKECMKKYNPRIVVLVGGENDLANDGTTSDYVFSYFEKCWRGLTGTEGSKSESKSSSSKDNDSKSRLEAIIYMGTKPELVTQGLHKEYLAYDKMIKDKYNELKLNQTEDHNESCHENNNIKFYFIDSWDIEMKRYYANDGLHLSELGYAVWEERLGKVIRTIKGIDSPN